jgi:hypothetical protein
VTLEPAASADGFLTVPLLDAGAVSRLRAEFDRFAPPEGHGFHASSAHGSRADARAADQLLKAALRPALAEVLPGHEPVLAAFISKGVADGAVVDVHQDWTYTDERHHRAVLLWIPLVDGDERNGALRVLPGSHRWTTGLRASGADHATAPLQDELRAQSVPVALEAGTAFVYDPALLHGSFPNTSPHPRPVVAIAFAPRDAPLLHFHVDDAGELTGWVIDESHYTLTPYAARPVGCAPYAPWAPLVSTEEIAPHLAISGAAR